MFVWDLDETIIIFHSLLTGTFASRYGKVKFNFFSITACLAKLHRELWGQLMRQLFKQMLPVLFRHICVNVSCGISSEHVKI